MKALTTAALMALVAATAAQAADDPKEPVPTVARATESPPARTAEQIAADEKSVRDKAEKDQERQAWAVKQMRAAGYKPQTKKDGTVLWCRRETPIGSHLEQERCSTIQAVQDTQHKGEEMTRELFGNKNIKLYSD